MRTTLRKALGVFLMLTLALFFVAACGDDDESTEETAESTPTEAVEEDEAESTTTTESVAEAELTITTAEVVLSGEGTFTTSGEAVDEGMICTAGAASMVNLTDGDGQPPPWTPEPTDLLADWEFVCEDGSGTLTMQVAQPAYSEPDVAAAEGGAVMGEGEETWEIMSGTGDYTAMTGEGTRTWQIPEPDEVQSNYIGTVSTE